MLFCAPIIGLWYWCTDQYIVQRALGAPNEQQARRGSIFASMLKLLPVFIFIIPGMICFALAKSGNMRDPLRAGRRERPWRSTSRPKRRFRYWSRRCCPRASAASSWPDCWRHLMSSLAGVFNASSTLFTMDFYSKLHSIGVAASIGVDRPRGHDGRMVLIGLAWIPVIQGAQGLYEYLQGVQAYLAPPIFVVFFLGVFWKRLNGPGCMAAL